MVVDTEFQQTEVGLIPQDWIIEKIGAFADVTAGGTPSTMISKYWNGDIRWMNSGELNFKRVFDVENRITELGLSNSATRLIPEKCVLIGLAGQGKTRGTVAMNMVELCTNQSIAAIHPSKLINQDYLFYNLDNRYSELRGLSTGDGGRGGLNLTIIKNLFVACPPFPEQVAIATALSDMDELITQTEKLIEKKKAIKQGVMQELLRPKEGWVMKKFTDVVDYIHGKAHEQYIVEDGKYKVVNSKFISSDGEVVKYSNTSFLTAKENDILTVLSDLPNGKALAKCFLVDQNNLYAVNQRICIWRTKGADPLYLYYILNRHAYFLQLDDGVTQTHILNGDINKFELSIIEDVQKQREIGIILRDIDNEINILENKNGKLQLQKQGMMQVLLTGKIRLI
jgi:type I restriction enzyme S subunit